MFVLQHSDAGHVRCDGSSPDFGRVLHSCRVPIFKSLACWLVSASRENLLIVFDLPLSVVGKPHLLLASVV